MSAPEPQDEVTKVMEDWIQAARRCVLSPEKHARTEQALIARWEATRQKPAFSWKKVWLPGASLVAATAALLLFLWFPRGSAPLAPPHSLASPGWTRHEVASLGLFESRNDSTLRFPSLPAPADKEIRLDLGELRAEVEKQPLDSPLQFVTPHLIVTVIGTRLDVQVTPEWTRVTLIEGRVWADSPYGHVELMPGEMVVSNDPRLLPHTPSPLYPRVPELETPLAPAIATISPSPTARSARLLPRRTSLHGAGPVLTPIPAKPTVASLAPVPSSEEDEGRSQLEAESRAFREALQSHGAERLSDFLTKFPDGLFSSEAMLRLMERAHHSGNRSLALETGERFRRHYPRDPRMDRVLRLEANILCESPVDPSKLEQTVERLRQRNTAYSRATLDRLTNTGCIVE